MRTVEFEQRVRDALTKATRTAWPSILSQKLSINLIKQKPNVVYANVNYKRLATFEVELLDQTLLLVTIGFTGKDYEFHYFGFVPDDDCHENLDDLYTKQLMMKALKQR